MTVYKSKRNKQIILSILALSVTIFVASIVLKWGGNVDKKIFNMSFLFSGGATFVLLYIIGARYRHRWILYPDGVEGLNPVRRKRIFVSWEDVQAYGRHFPDASFGHDTQKPYKSVRTFYLSSVNGERIEFHPNDEQEESLIDEISMYLPPTKYVEET